MGVELSYSYAELKVAGYSVTALREAGCPTKQLHAAGFSLREMREGGSPWKELVIFLRTTHAQLVAAGYEGIDPKDKIFREYLPERKALSA